MQMFIDNKKVMDVDGLYLTVEKMSQLAEYIPGVYEYAGQVLGVQAAQVDTYIASNKVWLQPFLSELADVLPASADVWIGEE